MFYDNYRNKTTNENNENNEKLTISKPLNKITIPLVTFIQMKEEIAYLKGQLISLGIGEE